MEVNKAAEEAGVSFELIELDLASLKSVRAAADKLVADGRLFDVIIANAGVMATPLGKTEDGFETQFGTNHLGHFVFVNRIAKLIRKGGSASVYKTLKQTASIKDIFQVHRNVETGAELNTSPELTANDDELDVHVASVPSWLFRPRLGKAKATSRQGPPAAPIPGISILE